MLMTLNSLMEGNIVKRPSKLIKSPYVADVCLNGTQEEIITHSASLGCCGLADTNATVMVSPMSVSGKKEKNTEKKEDEKLKCSHRIYLSVLKEKGQEIIVGIHPKLAEELVERCLTGNYFQKLANVKSFTREKTIVIENQVNSRFDFHGYDENGIEFIMEVKSVPLADYEDIPKKNKKNVSYDDREYNTKIAYFPDGYKKASKDPVSPRALKHIQELTYLKKERTSNIRCIMCYVIQRDDVNRFTASVIDMHYKDAFQSALESGVEVFTLVIKWDKNGNAMFVRDDLPIV